MTKKELDQSLKDAKEILIPFGIASSRFAAGVATIIDQLRESNAEAKGRAPSDFKWYLSYTQPTDPTVRVEKDFVKELEDNTQVFLLARGYRWRGAIELTGTLPTQIKTRYEERARLICNQQPNQTHEAVNTVDDSALEIVEQILNLTRSLEAQQSVNSGFIRIAQSVCHAMKAELKAK
jgi:hypothetical protein